MLKSPLRRARPLPRLDFPLVDFPLADLRLAWDLRLAGMTRSSSRTENPADVLDGSSKLGSMRLSLRLAMRCPCRPRADGVPLNGRCGGLRAR